MESSKNISKKSGFKVPESYFDDFDIQTLKGKKQQHIAGFSVPENYFENFEVQNPKPTKIIRLNEFQKTLAIASILIVLLGTLLIGLLTQPQPQRDLNFSKIDKSVIENYLEDEMLMETDFYVENDDFYFKLKPQNFSSKEVIDNMDDSSLEQLIEY